MFQGMHRIMMSFSVAYYAAAARGMPVVRQTLRPAGCSCLQLVTCVHTCQPECVRRAASGGVPVRTRALQLIE
jgi:hypothetical protein